MIRVLGDRGLLGAGFLLCLGTLVSCSEGEGTLGSGGAPAAGGASAGGGPPIAGGTSSDGGQFAGGSGGALVGGAGGLGVGGSSVGGSGGTDTGGGGGAESGGAGLGGSPSGADWITTEERVVYSCGHSICHGGTEMLCLAKDADRTGGQGSFCTPGTTLYETLLATRVAPCGDLPLVDPGKPETSAILLLMTRQCGDFVMPADCPPPEQGYPNCWPEYAVSELAAWIAGGAERD